MGMGQWFNHRLHELVDQIDDGGQAHCLLVNRQITSSFHSLHSMLLSLHQQINKVTVTTLTIHIEIFNLVHGSRQLPFNKRCAITDYATLCLEI